MGTMPATDILTPEAHENQVYGTDRGCWCNDAATCGGVCLTVVVLGATGDLAAKKTFPSLAALFNGGFMPETFSIIGFGRSDYTDESLRKKVGEHLPGSDEQKNKFLDKVTYHQSDSYEEAPGFQSLQEELSRREGASTSKSAGRIFYLALPPPTYAPVMRNIKESCTSLALKGSEEQKSYVRVVVEKPFGKDLKSSEELACKMASLFTEEQVYRIDHFLGKELSQNLLVMRFTNTLLSSIWNNKNISNIQITMKEAFGTEGRGGYYDSFGVIRDVVQNHLIQILALLTMERPVSMHPDDIRDEKTKVVRSMRVVEQKDIVVGQYAAADGKPGYTDDKEVPDESVTATCVGVRIWCDNERWEGVPMIIRAGKALDETKTEVRVQFKSQAGFFGDDSAGADGFRNEFVMQLKPKDLMYLKFVMKSPGLEMNAIMSELNLTYQDRYDKEIPEAYERLILDVVHGNQQHFVRRDELRAAWAIFTPILHALDKGEGGELHKYPFGARSFPALDDLVKSSGYVRSSNYTWNESKQAASKM